MTFTELYPNPMTISYQSQALLQMLSKTFLSDMYLIRHGKCGWKIVTQFENGVENCQKECATPTEMNRFASPPADLHQRNLGPLTSFLDTFVKAPGSDTDGTNMGQPRVFSLGDNTCFIAARSTSDEGEIEVIGGVVTIDGLRTTERLLQLSVQSIEMGELQELQSQYAARLSSSFEELCFLRRLSQHIEYCVGNRSLTEVAQLVLGELRQIIGVEALCLIEAIPNQDTIERQAGKFVAIEGQLPASPDFWMDTLDGLCHQLDHTVVRNLQNSLYKNGFRDTRDVRSFAIAPIRKEDTLYGWLLAVNKKVPSEYLGVLLNSLGDDELGSMEASMLEVAARIIGAQAANHHMFKSLEQLVVDVIRTLVDVVEAKDRYTSGHSSRVAQIARRLAEQLQLSKEECETIYTSGLLHDIGKIGVRDEVLNKPGKLTDAEFEEIKLHPQIGVRLLEKIAPLEKYLPGVLSHHESVDGSGYPHGLQGEQIPLMARVIAVADALDAMTSHRPYRQGMAVAKAAAILKDGAGKQWDSTVVSAYFSAQEHINPLCNSWVIQVDSPRTQCLLAHGSSSEPTGERDSAQPAQTPGIPDSSVFPVFPGTTLLSQT